MMIRPWVKRMAVLEEQREPEKDRGLVFLWSWLHGLSYRGLPLLYEEPDQAQNDERETCDEEY